MARGFACLAAAAGWHSRRVLAWRLPVTMEAAFCVEALGKHLPGTASQTCQRDAAHRRDNTGQGSQLAGQEFTGVLLRAGVAISMDGKGASPGNVLVERLWRPVKHEEIHLRAYGTVGEARASIGRHLALHNGRRPHSSLDRKTPGQAYLDRLPQTAAA